MNVRETDISSSFLRGLLFCDSFILQHFDFYAVSGNTMIHSQLACRAWKFCSNYSLKIFLTSERFNFLKLRPILILRKVC